MGALLNTVALSRRFGGIVAVGGVDFSLPSGEVHGLIGPNGAGKTTFLNLISGHLRPSGGNIYFNGTDLDGAATEKRAAAGIRRTFQNLRLFREMTAIENVMVGLHANTKCEIFHSLLRTSRQHEEEDQIATRSREALDFVGLLPAADALAGSMPYGHQRLLEIARAIVGKPRLLLLDEPAAGLAGTEAARLVGLIRDIQASGVSVMLVEHHMGVVMRACDRITVLDYGRKLAEGTPSDIRTHAGVVEAYLGKKAAHIRPVRTASAEIGHVEN